MASKNPGMPLQLLELAMTKLKMVTKLLRSHIHYRKIISQSLVTTLFVTWEEFFDS
jgi:hypothetical protein